MSDKKFIDMLRKKRDRLNDLESKYKVIGVNFAVKEGAKVPIEEAMDYVADQIKESAQLIGNKKDLINHGRTPPE